MVRETAGLYLLGIMAFCLLLSIDLLSVLARFLIEQGASVPEVARLLFYKLPWFLHLTLPLALVFAILLATGRMAKDSELKATYAAGVSPYRLLLPLVALGVLVSGATIVNNGFLEPIAERRYQAIIDAFVYVRPPNAAESDVVDWSGSATGGCRRDRVGERTARRPAHSQLEPPSSAYAGCQSRSDHRR